MKWVDKKGINLYHSDCMEIMAQMPDNWADVAIVDPQYGINVNVSMGRRKGQKSSGYHKFAGNDSKPMEPEYFDELGE